MTIRIQLPRAIAVAVALASMLVVGCGSGGEGPDTQQQQANVKNAQNLRSYFDKAGGNYDSLSDVDKAAYMQLSGGEQKARQNWELMKNGPGAADRSGQPAPSGGEVGR